MCCGRKKARRVIGRKGGLKKGQQNKNLAVPNEEPINDLKLITPKNQDIIPNPSIPPPYDVRLT
jgi:hypothetical protein